MVSVVTTTFRDIINVDHSVVVSIFAMAAWGGVVRYIMTKHGHITLSDMPDIICQVIMSCFSGFILSVVALAHNGQNDKVLMLAGLGGVFSGPIITLLGKKINEFTEKATGSSLPDMKIKGNK
ncbi:phage holin family protein [Lelliottia sp. CFBP8978]|uniref:phage holin family protein n=1 Tax=Lelliottia sp. CFBP8978 TaxID=3096522 RepID=UPI002A6A51BB|nr:phage holin family protein [Lelliottia sp. CFBP8978]MDY1038720.1 phage holin family protein [Lelliottia sp. CFBP8978]